MTTGLIAGRDLRRRARQTCQLVLCIGLATFCITPASADERDAVLAVVDQVFDAQIRRLIA